MFLTFVKKTINSKSPKRLITYFFRVILFNNFVRQTLGHMPLINTIILADDDADDVDVFKDALEKHITLSVVKNGVELMSLLHHVLPDLLFLDLEMPQKNGLECLVEIRNNEIWKEIPVVVFSSTTRQHNIQTAYEMGAHLFLIKAFDFKELVKTIKAVLALDWSQPNAIKDQYCINNRYVAFS